jgi:hypothetical protein
LIRKLIIATVVAVGSAFLIQNAISYYGDRMHVSEPLSGLHQHYFWNASQPLPVFDGDILFQYVYIDPLNIPRELMLQWHVNDSEGWGHRAYWGEDIIDFGDVNLPRTRMGPMPNAGEWIRLEVPASVVNLENKQVDGLAYTLFDGRAAWDNSGKNSRATAPPPTPTATPTPTPTPTPRPKNG